MTPKYVVVYRVPDYVRQVAAAAYERVTGRDLPTHNLHISFIYPFFLSEGYGESWLKKRISRIEFEPIAAWLANLEIFRQHKEVLYIRIEPATLLEAVHRKILVALRRGIVFDMSPYANGELPPYLPHISIDYNFDGDPYTLSSLQAERIAGYFDVDQLSIFKYTDDSLEEI